MKPGVKAHMGEGDAWPEIRDTILGRGILILSTPIWLGHPSSSAQRVLERLNAELSETDDEGRMLPEQAKAHNAIKDCDRRLARYQAALDAHRIRQITEGLRTAYGQLVSTHVRVCRTWTRLCPPTRPCSSCVPASVSASGSSTRSTACGTSYGPAPASTAST